MRTKLSRTPRPVRLFFSLSVCVILAVTAPVDGAHHEEGQSKAAQPSSSPSVSDPKTFDIQGTVFNGTRKLPASEGLEVRLVFIDGSNVQPLGVARTDASGNFVFPDVKSLGTKKGHLLAMTQYQEVPYFGLVKVGGKPARLLIYDLTQDPSGIVVESHQLLSRYEEGRLLFREVIRLANTGQATYAPDGTETLSFQLPEGAELLQPPSGMNPRGIQTSAGRITSVEPLPPGFRQVELVYAVPSPPAQLEIEKRFQYPTRKFSVMVPEFGMRLPSPTDLQYEGTVGEDIGNRVHLASKGDLPAGGRVSFVVSRDVESSSVEFLFLAMGLLSLSGVIGFFLGDLWLIVLAFKESVLWGFTCLLIPFASFYYAITRFNECKIPYYFYCYGVIALLSSYTILPTIYPILPTFAGVLPTIVGVIVVALAVPFAIRHRRLRNERPGEGKPSVRAKQTASVDGAQRPQGGSVPVASAGDGAAKVKSFADERSEILRKIASLDDAWEDGKIAKEEYERQRMDLKARVLEMARNTEKQ